jgi:hypothetical protein
MPWEEEKEPITVGAARSLNGATRTALSESYRRENLKIGVFIFSILYVDGSIKFLLKQVAEFTVMSLILILKIMTN